MSELELMSIKRTTAEGVAEAIRSKTGKTALLTSEEWEAEIDSISGSAPLAEYRQQNPIVDQYLEESQFFTPDDYSSTIPNFLEKFVYIEPDGYTRYYPLGHTVTLKTAGSLHLTDGGRVLVQSAAAGDHELVNSTPGKVACWWLTEDGTIKQSGTIKPAGQVRMIKTTAANVRDIGGWACDGGSVAYGKLYRGGYLSETDRAVLVNQLGVRHDLDIRNATERGGITESPLGADIHYTTVDRAPQYTLTPVADWRTILRTIFDAAKHDEPVYLHCKMGADRTGTVACIVEALLGVSQTDCDRDFELTSLATKPDARRRTDPNWVALMGLIQALPGDTFRNKVVNWAGNTLGFTVDKINEFRRSMINGTPEDVVIESSAASEYQRVAWVRIIDNAGSEVHAKYCIHSKIKWSECNKIICKVACVNSDHDLDIIFSAWTGADGATAPYIATRNEDGKFAYASGLTNYAVTPNDEPVASTEPQEYTMTFGSTNTNDMRLGGWMDTQYSHTHDWYYIKLYHDDTLLADYQPCYRKADGVIGFLETVSGDFELNGYNGESFTTKGPDI